MSRLKTLEEIAAIPKNMLYAEDVAGFLECDPHIIRVQAHEDPSKLGFPVIVAKRRVKIPKQKFLDYFQKEKEQTA